MKISIITICFNAEETLQSTLDSVASQDYHNIEYIVVDGGSSDGTMDLVKACSRVDRWVSEPDKGLYDAINKGIGMASGDYVGLIHADDFFASPNVISNMVALLQERGTDGLYADLQYVQQADTDQVHRNWVSEGYDVQEFYKGWMPPHPTFYCKRELFAELGGYRLDFGSAADYELMLRFMVKHKISMSYLPEVMVKMRVGGASNVSWQARWKANQMDARAWEVNGLEPKFYTRYAKPLRKLVQFF
ncbi:glycosyltransferase family 2 protein [Persicobacter sp. CCB-QB2]|uniref:glycosyltransferase family 2 protein n=1 Tax=Persicobacter sp. CCB-QB2 TaxID=1561025 RepID=UPI0006A997B9|nr:glycosyltransferase family 2 protein [Persicobacter sp. CCB-QB2]